MIFTPTPLGGAYTVDLSPAADERGFFGRTFCAGEFAARGLAVPANQCSISFNTRRGTLRGLHWQAAPHAEDKLVRCTRGALFDVIVDCRPGSATQWRWFAVELTAENRRAVFVPQQFAHGFLTLEDATEVLYMISVPYAADAARGLRWDDPQLGIRWPFAPTVISARDAAFPLLVPPGPRE